jgi:DNA repair protein RadA/Sms
MAVGNIIYSTSSTTIVSGDVINASDFERGTNLQVDTVSGNLNIAGGIRVDDHAIDLGVVAAVLSSNADLSIDRSICCSAEVGLSGEIRPVNRIDQRIREAEKLGFEKIIISSYNKAIDQENYKIELIKCTRIDEVLRALFA